MTRLIAIMLCLSPLLLESAEAKSCNIKSYTHCTAKNNPYPCPRLASGSGLRDIRCNLSRGKAHCCYESFDPNKGQWPGSIVTKTHTIGLPTCHTYKNKDGKLKKENKRFCSHRLASKQGLPPGSYLNSCSGCKVSNGKLTCAQCNRYPGKKPSTRAKVNIKIQKTCYLWGVRAGTGSGSNKVRTFGGIPCY